MSVEAPSLLLDGFACYAQSLSRISALSLSHWHAHLSALWYSLSWLSVKSGYYCENIAINSLSILGVFRALCPTYLFGAMSRLLQFIRIGCL